MKRTNKRTTALTWIIPVYNGARYIKQTIASILHQPCSDFDIIVVDDGSTDNTKNIIKSVSSNQIKYIYKENGGVSSARNVGIKAAHSKYIAFCDADDVVCKNVYTDQIHQLLLSEQYDLISFAHIKADQNLRYGKFYSITPGEETGNRLNLDPYKPFWSNIYHFSLFDLSAKEYFPTHIKISEDIAFNFIQLQSAKNILNINQYLYAYRNNRSSVMHHADAHLRATRMLTDVIPSWKWCKAYFTETRIKTHCDIRIMGLFVEYIMFACAIGIPLDTIVQAFRAPDIQEAFQNIDLLWNRYRAEFNSFMSNPRGYWISKRIRGFLLSPMMCLGNLPLFRQIYLRIKFHKPINEYIFTK